MKTRTTVDSLDTILKDITQPEKPERKRKATSSPVEKNSTTSKKVTIMAASAEQVECIRTLVLELKEDQKALRQSLEKRIDNVKDDLSERIELKFKQLKDDMSIEMAKMTDKIGGLDARLREIEECSQQEFPIEPTCVIINMKEEAGEDIDRKCEELLSRGLGLRIVPRRCLRLKSYTNRPDKVDVLHSKRMLKDKGSQY